MGADPSACASGDSSAIGSVTMLVLFMVVAGVAGGLANFILTESRGPDNNTPKSAPDLNTALRCGGYMFVGMVASFVVPLFLSLVKSDLLKDIFTQGNLSPKDTLEYLGFCLIAAISSRAFIQGISDKVLTQVRKVEENQEHLNQKLNATKKDIELVEVNIAEMAENISEPSDEKSEDSTTSSLVNEPVHGGQSLTEDEFKILRALEKQPYVRRSLRGISIDSGLEPGTILPVLGKLEIDGFVISVKSHKTGSQLYKISSQGSYYLSNRGTA